MGDQRNPRKTGSFNIRPSKSGKRMSFFVPFGGIRPRQSKKDNLSAQKGNTYELDAGPRPSLYEQMKSIFDRDIAQLPVYKDLHRLINRVSVITRKPGEREVLHKPYETENEALADVSSETKSIVNFLSHLIRFFEEEEIAESLVEEITECAQRGHEDGDSVGLLKEMVMIMGHDSRAARILKFINQSVILQGTFELKSTLTKSLVTKDVRGDEGWQICVTLAEFVQIKHVRKEQSVELGAQKHNHWGFEWEIRLTCDKNMMALTAANLRITDLTLGDEMDEALAENLRTTFGNGKLIVG